MELTRRAFCKLMGAISMCGCFPDPREVFARDRVNPLSGKGGEGMKLPEPKLVGDVSLEKAIYQRRTIRSFDSRPLTLKQCSQILWAAQGITEPGGYKRAAPSAGALYPMDVYGVIGNNCIEALNAGVYHYTPAGHALSTVQQGDKRKDVAEASVWQMWMAHAPLTLVITAEYSRITVKYRERGIRYAMIEAGHIGQNIFLQCQAMGLEAGIVGAFEDQEIIRVLGIGKTHEPLLIMPVGFAG